MKKIAIVVSRMVKSGTQRLFLEIAKANRQWGSGVQLDLVLINYRRTDWDEHLQELQELGVRVICLPFRCLDLPEGTPAGRLLASVARRSFEPLANHVTLRKLRQYDCLVFFEIFLLETMETALRGVQNIVLHVTEHQVQRGAANPVRFLKGDNVRLVFLERNQVDENAFRRATARFHIFPLCIGEELLAGTGATARHPIAVDEPVVIATYSRVSRMRFLDLQIRALAQLAAHRRAELWIYGYVEDRGYLADLEALAADLGVATLVKFKLNVPSVSESIVRDRPDLGWMISVGDAIGYGGIEMIGAGLPCLFVSIDPRKPHTAANPYSVNSPEALVQLTMARIDNLPELAAEQLRYVRESYLMTPEHYSALVQFYLGKEQGAPGRAALGGLDPVRMDAPAR